MNLNGLSILRTIPTVSIYKLSFGERFDFTYNQINSLQFNSLEGSSKTSVTDHNGVNPPIKSTAVVRVVVGVSQFNNSS